MELIPREVLCQNFAKVADLRVLAKRDLLCRAEERFILEIRATDLGQPIDGIIVLIRESRQLVPSLSRLKVHHVCAKLVTRPLTRASVDKATQVVFRGRLKRHVEDFRVTESPVNLVSCAIEGDLGLKIGLLLAPALHRVYLRRHAPGKSKQLFIAAQPVKLADAFEFQGMAFKVCSLPALERVAHLRRVLILIFEHLEDD